MAQLLIYKWIQLFFLNAQFGIIVIEEDSNNTFKNCNNTLATYYSDKTHFVRKSSNGAFLFFQASWKYSLPWYMNLKCLTYENDMVKYVGFVCTKRNVFRIADCKLRVSINEQ